VTLKGLRDQYREAFDELSTNGASSSYRSGVSGAACAMARTVSATIGYLWAFAAPTERRMPRTVARTPSESVGSVSQPASLWAYRKSWR
jgi:hypothetical protein